MAENEQHKNTSSLQKKSGRNLVSGFSKLNRKQRIQFLNEWMGENVQVELNSYLHTNPNVQKVFNEFSENHLSNYHLPFGIIPNVLINNVLYTVPVVIEESSVVAAASRSAGFWAKHGGFRTEILSTTKKGQVHFIFDGNADFLQHHLEALKIKIFHETEELSRGMKSRGGGITNVELVNLSHKLPNYYQLDVSFNTADAMGANFINSCLEKIAEVLQNYFLAYEAEGKLEVIMAILSNYTPESLVKCSVQCNVEDLEPFCGTYSTDDFVRRFSLAVQMAKQDVSRAVTHNKGIYNGVDGLILATGNDWRAVEAAGHAFASRNGSYQSLSEVHIENDVLTYSITLPLAIGTVGGLTQSHPLAKLALRILNNPNSNTLMELAAAVGLANNFSAVASLVTTGIQKGHMKMHLSNMLNQLNATEKQRVKAEKYFEHKTISFSALKDFITLDNQGK